MASLTRRVIASFAINKYSPEVAIAARNGRVMGRHGAWAGHGAHGRHGRGAAWGDGMGRGLGRRHGATAWGRGLGAAWGDAPETQADAT